MRARLHPGARAGARIVAGAGSTIGRMPARQNMDLKHQFLIAMPQMMDPNFRGAVVYVCEHSEKGALGLVINRPTELTLERLFDKIDLRLEIAPWKDEPVFFGGPVQTERGFVLHVPAGQYGSTLTVDDDIALTTSKDVLEAIADGGGPSKVLVTLGYSGWGAGQLEQEIADNAWLTVRADARVIFDMPAEERFSAALELLGVNSSQLSDQAGHA
jgi:putative transcriptional regulator